MRNPLSRGGFLFGGEMRLFAGIRLSEEISRNLFEMGTALSRKIREARPVPPENLHLTLRFIGEVEEERVGRITDVLSESCRNFEPFVLSVKGTGVFPDRKRMRIFWAGADSGGILRRMNSRMEKGLEAIGFPAGERFKEHITVARFRSVPSITAAEFFLEKYGGTVFGSMNVEKVDIIRSILSGGNPVYETLEAVLL